MKKIITLGLILCLSASVLAQTDEERAQITKNYDLEKLEQLRIQAAIDEEARIQRVQQASIENGWPLEKIINDEKAYLYDVFDGHPAYRTVENRIAALMQQADALWNGGSLGINVEGQNMQVGIWDGGLVLPTHEALSGRILVGQQGIGTSGHGTHVGGTIISNGANNPVARGIAPQATLISYDFADDFTEMVPEATAGLLLSNHSYGVPASNGLISFLGKYSSEAFSWDNLIFNAPYYLPVLSAGNSRNDGVNNADGGYDLLTFNKVAKNVLTVGASVGTPNYTGPASVPMSSFSSWGPADDGRVKPDITTKGVNTFSTDNGSDASYVVRQGTSMSSPAVTGGLTLLQQYYNQLNNQFMLAATLKGLALHTVFEAGPHDGPDYQFGWGLLNTEAAAIAIRDNGDSSLIEERNLATSATYSTNLNISSSSRLVVSISWTDPAGIPNNGPVDDPTPALRNDLDVQVTDSNGNVYYPWKLDPSAPTAAGTNNSTNDVDNFEKIEIDNPSGNYTIQVSHKGSSLVTGSQNYSLVVTGADPATFSTNGPDNLDNLALYPNPANDRFTVSFNNQLSGDTINVEVYDVLGQRVMMNSFDNTGVFEETIDASILNSGIYLVRVGNGATATTKKLIIE